MGLSTTVLCFNTNFANPQSSPTAKFDFHVCVFALIEFYEHEHHTTYVSLWYFG